MTPSILCRRRCLPLALGVLAAMTPARAGDDVPRPQGPRGLEVRIFDVSGLVAHRPDFRMERAGVVTFSEKPRADKTGPAPTGTGGTGPVDGPVFGDESDEAHPVLATVDGLLARVLQLDPDAFERDGLRATSLGDDRIAVWAPPPFQQLVAEALAVEERRALTVATIDVIALRGEATPADGIELAGAIARGALTPLSGARSGGLRRQYTARVGSERAVLVDSVVRVAKSARTSDPLVGIAKDGVAFEARMDVLTPAHAVVELSAWWSTSKEPVRRDSSTAGDGIESIAAETRRFEGVVELVPGIWKILPSSEGVRFAVRVSVKVHDLPIPIAPLLCRSDPVEAAGPVTARMHSVTDLGATSFGEVSRPFVEHLAMSNWEPPEWSDEGRKESPAFSGEFLVDLITASVQPSQWNWMEREIVLRDGHLDVRTDEAHDRAIVAFLDALRRQFAHTIDLRATVVTMPLASLPEYWTGLGDGALLVADGGRALLGRAGARIVDRSFLHVRPGQRNAAVGGTQHRYVADYDVEIAEDAVIGKPVVRAVLDGMVFDIEVDSVAGGTAVLCALRLHRGVWLGSRQVPTRHGDIECPTLGVSSVHGEIVVPIGATRIVGAAIEGDSVTLTLLGASER